MKDELIREEESNPSEHQYGEKKHLPPRERLRGSTKESQTARGKIESTKGGFFCLGPSERGQDYLGGRDEGGVGRREKTQHATARLEGGSRKERSKGTDGRSRESITK